MKQSGWSLATAVFGVVVPVLVSCAPAPEAASEAPKPNPSPVTDAARGAWAKPLKRPGLPNLHRVTPTLYRGAQPTAEGFRQLKALGVRTVINLRSFHSDRDEIGDTGLAYEHLYMKAWHPEQKEIVRFLQIVTDPRRTPAFVHCQHGADRTGLMCAVYRIIVGGWSKQEAIAEMTGGDFGFHGVWANLVRFIEELDVEAVRQAAGLMAAAGSGQIETKARR
jgi:protein tyrosine phosphatase (PTP) superfamily phosphohydrolase (DUF442 family)